MIYGEAEGCESGIMVFRAGERTLRCVVEVDASGYVYLRIS
jgi:hypothetical protein